MLFIFSSFLTPAAAQTYRQCSSAVVDVDGDGWGYENYRSCRMASSSDGRFPDCSANAIVDASGWGFENGRSCRFTSDVQATNGVPVCTSAAIVSSNGWGWENYRSCRFSGSGSSSNDTASSTSTNSYPIVDMSGSVARSASQCGANATDNGNGWGYEYGRSCIWNLAGSIAAANGSSDTANSTVSSDSGNSSSSNTSDSSSSTASTSSANSNSSSYPECSANAEGNGTGWGYEFGRSCLWGSVQPASNTQTVVAAPVTARAIGFENGTPVCLTDASDGNGDGFGYENDRTCVVTGSTATSQNPLMNTRWCQPWAEISYDDYVLQNNTWNDSDVYSDRWSQCIELGGSRGNYVAKWDYNWLGRNEGNEYSVKSYPQVYYGRKTGNTTSGTPQKLGVPVNVNNVPDFKVRYKYSETGIAERNVALESFFHTSCEAEEWNKHFEMMIWVNKPVIRTPGTLVTEATIDGKLWEVYINPALSWGYVAFVEKTPSTEGWLNWKEFVDWTRFQGPQYGVWQVGNTCMGAIEIGTETFWGNGTFTLHEFKVTR